MRTMTAAQQAVLESTRRESHLRVYIEDSGGTMREWTDLSGVNYVKAAQWGETLDAPMITGRVDLHWQRMHDNASPFVTSSRYSGYLGAYRKIWIDVATVPPGVTPAAGDYQRMVVGTIDSYDLSSPEVCGVEFRERVGAHLMDHFISNVSQRGAANGQTLIENVCSNLVHAYHNSLSEISGTDDEVSVYVPTSTAFACGAYNQTPMPVLNACRNLASQIGWDIRPRWRESTEQFELTLYEPDRSAGATGYTIPAALYRRFDRCRVDLANIRNYIKVYYGPYSSSAPGAGRGQAFVKDDASIAKYGRRWMEIAESASSLIDTQGEAEALAGYALSDLAEPTLDLAPVLPLFWPVELNDFYTFAPDGLRFESAQDLAVYGYQHTVAPRGAWTSLQVMGKPSAGKAVWTSREARPGKHPAADDLYPGTPTVSATGAALGGTLTITRPDALDYAEMRIHRGSSGDFVPSDDNLIATTRADRLDLRLSPTERHYYKAVALDISGNASEASNPAWMRPEYVGEEEHPPELRTYAFAVSLSADQQVTGASPPETLEFDTWTYGEDATLFDTSTHRFTAKYDGLHRVRLYVVGSAVTSGTIDSIYALLRLNDGKGSEVAEYRKSVTVLSPSSGTELTIDVMLPLNEGDTIDPQVYMQGKTSPVYEIGSALTTFEVVKLSNPLSRTPDSATTLLLHLGYASGSIIPRR